MPAPRAIGALGSTGTYAAPARRIPCSAATASRPLGQEQADPIAAPDPPARQSGGRAIGGAGQFGEGQGPAPFVLDGRVAGPPRGGPVEQLAEVASVVHAHRCVLQVEVNL
jgi:hypothetical protein